MLCAAASLLLPALSHAQEPGVVSPGDTAWVLTSSVLVLMMTAPGLALFYGGLVRSKNILSVLMQCFVLMCVISVQWVLYGYSLAFGTDHGHVIGGLDFLGLRGVGPAPNEGATIPALAFMVFQMMFAIITPALIVGAFAERMKFSAFLLFSIVWATIIYDPLCHMVWGSDGLIGSVWGALGFAGGTVVHISSGVSALVCAFVIGKRLGYGSEPMPPHNLPFTVIGAGLLWVGWFGFNAGSALAADGLAATAFVTTNTAAAAAGLGWMVVEWLARGKPTMLGVATGAVAGLVVVTPAAGFVTPLSALLMGAIGGVLCYGACNLKSILGWYDDALDVVGVHGVGGTWGAIATGLWASTEANSAVETQGLLVSGEWGLLGAQIAAVLFTFAFAAVGTLIALGVTGAVTGGVRVVGDDEFTGLDLSQHSESAYLLGPAPASGVGTHGA